MKKRSGVMLKAYSITEELFDSILLAGYTVKTITDADEFYNYKFGYDEKTVIYYDGLKCMILLECILNEHTPIKNAQINYWRQCIVYKNIQLKEDKLEDTEVRGIDAFRYINAIISKYYNDDEKEERFKMFEADYNENLIQYHFLLLDRVGKIFRYDNCYKWDINGAHNAALCEIFPKAAKDLTNMYVMRKKYPKYKCYINYYVGILVNNGHRRTYNWIVQNTTKLLLDGIEQAGGDLIYANTDGFIVQNPTNLIPHSTTLGGYKLEYSGPVWVYHDKNYQCYQLNTKEIKGSVLHSVRDHIDLPNGKVVHYDKIQEGGPNSPYIAINIRTEVLSNG